MWPRSLAEGECLLELQEGGALFIRRETRELICFSLSLLLFLLYPFVRLKFFFFYFLPQKGSYHGNDKYA